MTHTNSLYQRNLLSLTETVRSIVHKPTEQNPPKGRRKLTNLIRTYTPPNPRKKNTSPRNGARTRTKLARTEPRLRLADTHARAETSINHATSGKSSYPTKLGLGASVRAPDRKDAASREGTGTVREGNRLITFGAVGRWRRGVGGGTAVGVCILAVAVSVVDHGCGGGVRGGVSPSGGWGLRGVAGWGRGGEEMGFSGWEARARGREGSEWGVCELNEADWQRWRRGIAYKPACCFSRDVTYFTHWPSD